jgi:molybdopterin-synthase adenylyltransferase
MAESAASRIRGATATWGILKLVFDEPDRPIGVTGAAERQGPMYDTGRTELIGHALSRGDEYASGFWYRAQPELHNWHAWLMRAGGVIPAGALRDLIIDGWRQPAAGAATAVVTYAPGAERKWAAWSVSRDRADPVPITILREPEADPLAGLPSAWPLGAIRSTTVAVIGAGGIGSAAASALAMYGVGTLVLVDDDRLLWHNLSRHQIGRADVGRYKVDAIADALSKRWPSWSSAVRRPSL